MLPYQSGANDLIEGRFLGGFMEITAPNESATLSGRACGRLVSDELSTDDRRRAFYYTLMPNLMLSIHPDYVNYYLVTPVAVDRTIVESEWLFHPSNADNPDFNPTDAISFWDVTNRSGLGHRRAQPARHLIAALRARPVLGAREHSGGVGSRLFRDDGVALSIDSPGRDPSLRSG